MCATPANKYRMDLRTLFEDEESDRAERLQAVIAFNQISGWLSDHEESLPDHMMQVDLWGERGFALTPHMLHLDTMFPNIVFLFMPKSKTDVGGFEPVASLATKGNQFFLIVRCLLNENDPKYLPDRFRVGAKKSFIHEFIHYVLRMKTGPLGQDTVATFADKGPEAYFNHPDETNAYYQEAAHEAVEIARMLQREVPVSATQLNAKTTPELVRWFKARCFDKDFMEWANSKTMRALDKRLARLIDTTIRPIWATKPPVT